MAAKECPKCKGCGKLASSNQEPWSQFAGKAYNSEEMKPVANGDTVPLNCPECGGSGVQAEAATKEKTK